MRDGFLKGTGFQPVLQLHALAFSHWEWKALVPWFDVKSVRYKRPKSQSSLSPIKDEKPPHGYQKIVHSSLEGSSLPITIKAHTFTPGPF